MTAYPKHNTISQNVEFDKSVSKLMKKYLISMVNEFVMFVTLIDVIFFVNIFTLFTCILLNSNFYALL